MYLLLYFENYEMIDRSSRHYHVTRLSKHVTGSAHFAYLLHIHLSRRINAPVTKLLGKHILKR